MEHFAKSSCRGVNYQESISKVHYNMDIVWNPEPPRDRKRKFVRVIWGEMLN